MKYSLLTGAGRNASAALIVLMGLSPLCNADSIDTSDQPFYTSNRNPFVQVYGLPATQGAKLTEFKALSTALSFDVANSFSRDANGDESIFIDGETQRTNLQLRYGLTERFELGLDIPYLHHDGGGLDGFIDDWHETWGLPEGDRPDFARDQLQYSYQRQGITLANVTRSTGGIGDVSISTSYALNEQPTRQWSLRAHIKLPTGDAQTLTGSESTDVALALHVSDQALLADYRVSLHANMGMLWMDGGEVLIDQRKDWVAYGSTTLAWQYTPSINLKLQLDAHSAFYDSTLTELGDNGMQLTLGGTVSVGSKWLLDLAVIEDIAVDTAPDVVFQLGIKRRAW